MYRPLPSWSSLLPLFHVKCAGTMAVFASNCHFSKWRIIIKAVTAGYDKRTAGMANDASFVHRTTEALARSLISWRKIPLLRFGIKRQRRLEKKVSPADGVCLPIRTRADDVFEFVCLLENGAGRI